MTPGNVSWLRRWILVAAAVGAVGMWLPVAGPVRADELADLDSSLKLIPSSAAFYSSSMRWGELAEIVAQSRAWARLKDMPSVQEALRLYEDQSNQPGQPAAKVKEAMELPVVADVIGLAKDMFAQDVFIFGDDRYPEFVRLVRDVGNATRYGPMVAKLTGESEGVDEGKLQAKLLLSALAERADSIVVPTTILGFKITDKDRAERNLSNLAGVATLACAAVPQLYGAAKRTPIDGSDFLVVSLDGEMVPWDKVPMDDLRELETTPGDLDKVIAKLKQLKLVAAIGVRGDYLMISTGPSTECLEHLGSGELLIERPELEPLKKFADQRLTGIRYTSRAMNEQAHGDKKDVDALLATIEKVLPCLELPEADKEEILRDARVLATDIKGLIPTAGAVLTFSFLTGQGIEGYSYNGTENLVLDGSKPLTLLEHVGGNPLLAAVWRERYAPENYDLVSKWFKIGCGYFEKYAVPQMSPHDRKKYERLKALAGPLPGRIDRANREMLLPALADSQGGLVLDAKLQIRKLVECMPDPGKDMPMAEPAVVVGVSDANLLRRACDEYRSVAEAFLDAIREIEPGAIPEFEIPEPEINDTQSGTIYSYRLPECCGLNGKIVPSIGLSDSLAVVALTVDHAQRLLDARPLDAIGAIGDGDRQRAVAFLLDSAGLIEAARPWAEQVGREVIRQKMHVDEDSSDEDKAQAESMLEQVDTVLDVLQVLRSVTCEHRIEGGVSVTHSLVEFCDVD